MKGFTQIITGILLDFLCATNGKDRKTNYVCKQLLVLYLELGNAFFADNPNASEQGHNNFIKYMFMLDKYISEQLPEAFKDDDNDSEADSKENDDKEETLEELLEQLNCLVGLIDVKKDVHR